MIQIDAIFENGLIRPLQPLPLHEGETVRISVLRTKSIMPEMTSEEAAYASRLAAAKTLEEKMAVMNSADELPEGYDLIEALNRNRAMSGSLPWFPVKFEGASHE